MAGFTDRFGGSTIQAAQVAYRAVDLTANQVLLWSQFATGPDYLARIMQVASTGVFSLTLPDATEATPGFDFFVNNVGAFAVTILDAAGNSVATVTPGQSKYLYLTDSSTAAGTWQVIAMGTTPSNVDAGGLAGAGLLAIGATLNQSAKISAFAGNASITAASRAQVFVWQGGAGTLTLPLSAAVTDFFFEVRNQGAGVLTIPTAPASGETIDGSGSIALQIGESCFVHAGSGAWYTVGRGRSASFAFTQLVKTVTGGTTTLTLTEAANVVQTYNGVLTAIQNIILPPLVQVYYVSNQTSGAFSFNVRTAAGGAFVSIPSGQNAVLFCDGTNVINASTTVAGISSLVMSAGSAASPSLALGTTNSGLYAAVTDEVSITSAGVKVAGFSASGLSVSNPISSVVATGNTGFSISRPAGAFGVLSFKTGVNPRWDVLVDNTAEGGSNAGSNLSIVRYNDAGASLGANITVNRATGAVVVANAGADVSLSVDRPAGSEGRVSFTTAALRRWSFRVSNDAESGANVGSNWSLDRFADAGTYIDSPIVVARSSGALQFNRGTTPAVKSLAFSASLSIDATDGDVWQIGVATANMTGLTVANPTNGKVLAVRYQQDGTGGRVLSVPVGAKVQGAYSTVPNQVSTLSLMYIASRFEGSWTIIPL